MTENRYLTQKLEEGTVNISDEVVSTVAALAAAEVDGVYALAGRAGTDRKEKIAGRGPDKGIALEIGEHEIRITCNLIVTFGYTIIEVAKKVQERVAATVESSTGFHVDVVNVRVVGMASRKKASEQN